MDVEYEYKWQTDIPRCWRKDCSVVPFEAPAPLVLTFCFQDQMCVKVLDYEVFAQWDAVEAVLQGVREMGIVVERLWDTVDDTRVGGGDWNARVRPGWNVKVLCLENGVEELGGGFEEEDEESAGAGGVEEGEGRVWGAAGWLGRKEKETAWWFARWRERVEKEIRCHGHLRDPSWEMVVGWCFSMVTFVVMVSVLCVG